MVSPTGIFFLKSFGCALVYGVFSECSKGKMEQNFTAFRGGERVCVCVFSPHRIQLMKVAFLLAFIGNNCGISVRSASCRLWFSDLHCVNTVPVHLRKEAHLWRP